MTLFIINVNYGYTLILPKLGNIFKLSVLCADKFSGLVGRKIIKNSAVHKISILFELKLTEEPSPLVQSSITPYEQKVSLTLYWLTAESHSAGLSSTSEGGMRME